MLTDISLFFGRSGADSPKPLEPVRLEFDHLECGQDEEKAFFLYESDPKVYDSGKMLTVVYRRNQNELNALENRLLDYEEEEDGDHKETVIMDALDEVFLASSLFYPTVTRITLETVKGILTSLVTEDKDEIIPYLPIPPHLSHISTVPITELLKVHGITMYVDRVKWKDQTFAFKKTGEHLEGTFTELEILDRLRGSPNIINLTAIVVNQENTVRGFLMPYMYAGDLADFFSKVREDLHVSEDSDIPIFDWSIKHTWACQITQGVVELHAIGAYNGDLKPRNVLIGPTGQAILIDFLPIGFSDEFSAPEVLAKQYDHNTTLKSLLSGPSDVYSLGLILYALAQENECGVRIPSWGDGSAPYWFRDVVQRCLHLDPSSRPSTAEVLSILQKGEP